jgi:hypothetical protein
MRLDLKQLCFQPNRVLVWVHESTNTAVAQSQLRTRSLASLVNTWQIVDFAAFSEYGNQQIFKLTGCG